MLPARRSAEPGSLVVCVGFDDRAELLAAAADVYYLTDHYQDYSGVVVRLSRAPMSCGTCSAGLTTSTGVLLRMAQRDERHHDCKRAFSKA